MNARIGLLGIVGWIAGVGALEAKDPPSTSTTLVWCGLDYSQVRMVGTRDFRKPDEIFPGMLIEWNSLFMDEKLKDLERLDADVESDLGAVAALNGKATPEQIERRDGTRKEMVDTPHLDQDDIAKAVKAYNLEHKEGLGLVFIMERLAKAQATGCLYIVFFDIKSRAVISSDRVVGEARGFGFRNYWFHPIKEAVEELPPLHRKAKAWKGSPAADQGDQGK